VDGDVGGATACELRKVMAGDTDLASAGDNVEDASLSRRELDTKPMRR